MGSVNLVVPLRSPDIVISDQIIIKIGVKDLELV